jgi:catechol 2,3-dioxygenase-like lactoylglutathione lyase family enzyme
MFVSQLDRSVDYYRDVLSCQVAIHDRDAALLLAPGGFQIYLIARGTRTPHSSGGIGLQYLIWAVESNADLRELAQAINDRGGRAPTSTSGGVTFLACRDPDGIRVLVAHPSPETLPRSVVSPHLYE